MNKLLVVFRDIFRYRFNLLEDKAENEEIINSIKKNVDFRGANLWALIFAIIIASIGLNVNSTAVIIGAMLISPIMGPVMGIGLGIGINDLDLVKRGAKNLLVATIISVIASTIYFSITPLHEAQSELLARTSPSIWDVFIAFFGGMAGMVAASRKEKNNVIPGVAIATALMPPLCTAGFAIATGNLYFFLGAIYLYFINSVFIAIATYLMSRYIHMPKKHFEDAKIEKKVNRYMIIIVVITILPSIYMAYRIVDKSIFENNASKFVEQEFGFSSTQVISKTYQYSRKQKSIDLLLIGAELNKPTIDSLQKKLSAYRLEGVKLKIRQGINENKEIDFSQIRASIMEEAFGKFSSKDSVARLVQNIERIPDVNVLQELKVLYPTIRNFGTGKVLLHRSDTTKIDTLNVGIAGFSKAPSQADLQKIQEWMRVRYKKSNFILKTE